MKKVILLTTSAILMSGVVACSNQDENKTSNASVASTSTASVNKGSQTNDVREAVFNQLSQKDKERIAGTWEDAIIVRKVTLQDEEGMIIANTNKSYIGKEVYEVIFKTNEKREPAIIAVLADVKTFQLIGKLLVQ